MFFSQVKIWFQNRRARERRDKEASRRNHSPVLHKVFQPLSIPTVGWPMTTMTSSDYAQYQQTVLDFRQNCLKSANFGVYNKNVGDSDGGLLPIARPGESSQTWTFSFSQSGNSGLAPKWIRLAPNGTNLGLYRSGFSTLLCFEPELTSLFTIDIV